MFIFVITKNTKYPALEHNVTQQYVFSSDTATVIAGQSGPNGVGFSRWIS